MRGLNIISLKSLVKRIHLQCKRPRFDPWIGKIPWKSEWLPMPVFLSGEFPGQRSLWSMGLQRVGHSWATNSFSFPLYQLRLWYYFYPVTIHTKGLNPSFAAAITNDCTKVQKTCSSHWWLLSKSPKGNSINRYENKMINKSWNRLMSFSSKWI